MKKYISALKNDYEIENYVINRYYDDILALVRLEKALKKLLTKITDEYISNSIKEKRAKIEKAIKILMCYNGR